MGSHHASTARSTRVSSLATSFDKSPHRDAGWRHKDLDRARRFGSPVRALWTRGEVDAKVDLGHSRVRAREQSR